MAEYTLEEYEKKLEEEAKKATEKEPKKVGRPRKPIDWDTFEGLCRIHCTNEEIASILKVDTATLYYRVKKQYGLEFPVVYKEFSSEGKASLRRSQFKLAQKNAAMGIWLGKQHLGQRDEHKEAETEAHKFVVALKQMIEQGDKPSDDADTESRETED